MAKNLLFFIALLISTNLPLSVEAATPANYVASVIDETVAQIKFPKNIFTGNSYQVVSLTSYSSVATSFSSSSKNYLLVQPAKKTKSKKDAKSGVTIILPAKPAFVLNTKKLSEQNPNYGYVYEIGVKEAKRPTALAIVSSGILGIIGWDSMQYGAESSMRAVITKNSFKLPPEILSQLKFKNETLQLDGELVTHNFIEYKGMHVLGTYASMKKYDKVVLGIISMYAESSLLPSESRTETLTEMQAQELLVTALTKSKVNQKQAKNYFLIN